MSPARLLWSRRAALGVALLLGASAASAQLTAGYAVASFQFNLSNPGARSLAMGGAFAGLADDATAAYANPAGLNILTRAEFSFEGRSANLRLPLVSAEPNRAGTGIQLQTGSEILFEEVIERGAIETASLGAPDATESNASFISFVFPLRRWTFALFRHQLVDLEASGGRPLPELRVELEQTDPRDMSTITRTSSSTASTAASTNVDISSIGLAGAFRLSRQVSLGLTLVRNRASIVTRRSGQGVEERSRIDGSAIRFGQATENAIGGDDSELTFNAGLLARPGDRFAIGVVFRQGPSFRLDEFERTSFSEFIAFRPPIESDLPSESFDVPDVYAAGASFKATARLLFAFEWTRVGYSNLRIPSRLPRAVSFFASSAIEGLVRASPDELGSFRVDDVDELRAGMEYSFWRVKSTPAIRLGVWLDPDHQIRFEPSLDCPRQPIRGSTSYECVVTLVNDNGPIPREVQVGNIRDVSLATIAESLAQLFPPGKDRVHVTGGVGVVLGSRYQLDAAFDYVSSDQYVLSLSGVVRF